MQHYLLILFFLVPVAGKAGVILIRAPQVSPAEFNNYLQQHKGMTSYVDHSLRELQNNQQQEARLFQLGDTLTQGPSASVPQIKEIQSESPLTLLSLRYIRDLTEKNLSMKVSPSERQELLHLYCKSALLLQEGPLLFPCSPVTVMPANLQRIYPNLEKIVIESRAFSVQEMISFNNSTPYHWTLLSNAQRPLHFYGTLQQLLNQRLSPEDLVKGGCEEFSTENLDFAVLSNHRIFFSETCVHNPKTSQTENSWISERKPWLYAIAAVTLGGLLYGLKDKTLVMEPLP